MSKLYELFRYFTKYKQRESELVWKHWYHRHYPKKYLFFDRMVKDNLKKEFKNKKFTKRM